MCMLRLVSCRHQLRTCKVVECCGCPDVLKAICLCERGHCLHDHIDYTSHFLDIIVCFGEPLLSMLDPLTAERSVPQEDQWIAARTYLIVEGQRQVVLVHHSVLLCEVLAGCRCVRVIRAEAPDCFRERGGHVLLCILKLLLQMHTIFFGENLMIGCMRLMGQGLAIW